MLLTCFAILAFSICNMIGMIGMFRDIVPDLEKKDVYTLASDYDLTTLQTYKFLAQEEKNYNFLLKKLEEAITLRKTQAQEIERQERERVRKFKSYFKVHSSGTIEIIKSFEVKDKEELKEKLISLGHKKFFYDNYTFDATAKRSLRGQIILKVVPEILKRKKDNIVYTDFGAGRLESASLKILALFLNKGGTIKDIHVIDTKYQSMIDSLLGKPCPKFPDTLMQRMISIMTMLSSLSKNKINFYMHSNAYAYIDFLNKRKMEKADVITGFYIPVVAETGFRRDVPFFPNPKAFLDLCYAIFNGTKDKVLFIQGVKNKISIAKSDFKKMFEQQYNEVINALSRTLGKSKKQILEQTHKE